MKENGTGEIRGNAQQKQVQWKEREGNARKKTMIMGRGEEHEGMEEGMGWENDIQEGTRESGGKISKCKKRSKEIDRRGKEILDIRTREIGGKGLSLRYKARKFDEGKRHTKKKTRKFEEEMQTRI